MAVTTQTLRDSEHDAIIKIVCTEDGEGGTTIDVSTLAGAEDDGTDRVAITKILLSIPRLTDATQEPVTLDWDATSNVAIAEFGSGNIEWDVRLDNNAADGVTGDIIVTSAHANTKFTMILFLKKTAGFAGTALSYRQVMPPRRA